MGTRPIVQSVIANAAMTAATARAAQRADARPRVVVVLAVVGGEMAPIIGPKDLERPVLHE